MTATSLRALQEPVGDGVQGAVRPARAAAAEEHAVGMAVLAAGHGAEIGDVAHLLAIGGELGLGRLDAGLAEVRRDEKVGDLEIALVHRIGLAVIDVVAVEVVALLRHAPRPGEAVGIDGMDEDRRRVARQAGGADARQPVDLEARAAEALDAMGAGDRHDDLRGILGAKPRHVGRQRLAARALGRVVVAMGRGAGDLRRRQELVARLAVVGGEGMDVGHDGYT